MSVGSQQGRQESGARMQGELASATAQFLRHIHQAERALTSAQEQIEVEERKIAELRDLARHHHALAAGVLNHARTQYSGSSRAWRILETKVYSRPFQMLETPRKDVGLNLHDVERAMGESIELRQVIDRPLIPKKRHTERFATVATFLEASRHGSEEIERRLGASIRSAETALADRRRKLEDDRRSRIQELTTERDRIHARSGDSWSSLLETLTTPATLPTGHDQWRSAAVPADGVEPILLGWLHAQAARSAWIPQELQQVSAPWIRDLRTVGNLVIPYGNDGPQAANDQIEQLTLRALTAFPPSTLRLAFVDPLGLGRADAGFIGLGDHDSGLVHGRVRSSREDIEDLLKELVAHIESVTQKYLRGAYSSIDEYNVAAEEIAEPYRLLVIHDFPEQFDKATTLHLLQRIMDNGPRCGVHTIIGAKAQPGDSYTPGFDDLMREGTVVYGPNDPQWVVLPAEDFGAREPLGPISRDVQADSAKDLVADRVELIGSAARGAKVSTGLDKALAYYARAVESGTRPDVPEGAVVADLDDPSTWWQNSSETAIVAPLGLSAAREAAFLRLDSESRSSALLIGRPGSGKSTLIHTWLSALTVLYSPQELDLQLVDFKEGVEFRPYARQELPHARAVAIESEREFGLNVLRSIEDEMRSRADLFKSMGNGVTSLGDYRRRSGRPLPRLVVVIDEFQVLFDTDDRIALAAATALEHIIRQGRGYGIHLLLGSQSLTGMIGLNKQVLQQIGTRILLPSSADDAALALGDRNDAHRHLTSTGQAVLNAEGGRAGANVFLTVAYEDDENRWARLDVLRERADTQGFARRPVVFSSDRAAERPALVASSRAGEHGRAPRLFLGESLGLGAAPRVELDRSPGRNLLAILRDGTDAENAFTIGVIDDVLRSSEDAGVVLCPFVGVGQEFDPYLETLADLDRVRVAPPRRLDEQLNDLARTVRDREEAGFGSRLTPQVLVLHGVHRAHGLAESVSSGFSFDEPETETADPAADLETVLERGPEVGVHVVAWGNGLASMTRRLSRTALAAFDLRLAGPLPPGEAGDFFDHGIQAPTKAGQALFMDRDSGHSEGVLMVSEVGLAWWRHEVDRLAGRFSDAATVDEEGVS